MMDLKISCLLLVCLAQVSLTQHRNGNGQHQRGRQRQGPEWGPPNGGPPPQGGRPPQDGPPSYGGPPPYGEPPPYGRPPHCKCAPRPPACIRYDKAIEDKMRELELSGEGSPNDCDEDDYEMCWWTATLNARDQIPELEKETLIRECLEQQNKYLPQNSVSSEPMTYRA